MDSIPPNNGHDARASANGHTPPTSTSGSAEQASNNGHTAPTEAAAASKTVASAPTANTRPPAAPSRDEALAAKLETYIANQGFPSHYIEADGRRAHYLVSGNGPAVLMLHGLGGCALNWVPVMKALSPHYRVYALDLLGFGLSEKPKGEITLADVASFIDGFLEAHTISRVILVGNSMGGLISLMYTLNHGDRVTKLILVDSAGIGADLGLPLRLQAAVGQYFNPDKTGVRRILQAILNDQNLIDDQMVDFYYDLGRLHGARESFLQMVRIGISMLNGQKIVVSHLLPLITQPTLILWGAKDNIVPLAHGRIAHKLIPNSRLHIMDKAGHCPQMEHPAEFIETVLRFLHGEKAVTTAALKPPSTMTAVPVSPARRGETS